MNDSSNAANNCAFAPYYQYCLWQPQPVYTASVVTTALVASSAQSTSTSAAAVVPSPTQPGSISRNCDTYAEAASGDYCYAFAAEHNITAANLYAWNSVLGTDGAGGRTDFWADEYYCVDVNGG